ncbi:hypothetical protein M0R45_025485 [Rubus argutus]|uniref:Uncharacterized protein n=1 Tax=Rubus argutus TaxID=59490 RepID=A0AAW1WUS2_RUBAR
MGSSQSSTNQEEGIRTENGRALSTGEKAAVAAGAIAGLAAVAWGAELVSGATSTSGEQRKTMKHPGRDERIFRDDFKRDPASHFRSLRNK